MINYYRMLTINQTVIVKFSINI